MTKQVQGHKTQYTCLKCPLSVHPFKPFPTPDMIFTQMAVFWQEYKEAREINM